MSHYDDWDYGPKAPRTPRVAASEKKRIDYTEPEGEVTEYAAEYDEMDRYASTIYKDEPETANLTPVRELVPYSSRKEVAEVVEKVREGTKYNRFGAREPVIFRRTVTYGPWEEVK